MFSSTRLAANVLAISSMLGLSQAYTPYYEPTDECYLPTLVYVSTNVVYYPVVLQTYISANTIININGGVTININNAPTYLDTTVTATSTTTEFSTVTATATATTTATVTSTPNGPNVPAFVLAVNRPAARGKRQVTGAEYIIFEGGIATFTTDKATAAVFSISNGELFSGGSSVALSNAELATGYGPFDLSGPADIATTWSTSIGSSLTFQNSLFGFGGFAEFCSGSDGFVTIEATSAPPGCFVITFTAESPSTDTSSTTASPTTSSSTANPSDDMTVEPTPTPRRAIKMHKKSMNGEVRRGGLLRSPMKRSAH